MTADVRASLDRASGPVRREAADGGQGRLLKLMETAGPGILRMLWRLLGNEQDVKDTYQECFCRLADPGSVEPIRRLPAYAYRTAANIAVELIRHRRRRVEHWPRVAASEGEKAAARSRGGALERREALDALRSAVAGLPEHLRQVVVLRDLVGLPYAQVGAVAGIGQATARVYRRQAIIRLAETMSGGRAKGRDVTEVRDGAFGR